MSVGFPTPEGPEVAGGDGRQGDPLYPGEHTIVNQDNEPLTEGVKIQVWFKMYADGHGVETVTGNLLVIMASEDDGEGDVFGIPANQNPRSASRVYRIASDLSTITAGVVVPRPVYNVAEGVLEINRLVQRRGHDENELHEVRSHGRQEFWGTNRGGGL